MEDSIFLEKNVIKQNKISLIKTEHTINNVLYIGFSVSIFSIIVTVMVLIITYL